MNWDQREVNSSLGFIDNHKFEKLERPTCKAKHINQRSIGSSSCLNNLEPTSQTY